MAKPIQTKYLSKEAREVLNKSLNILNYGGDLWWDNPEVKTLYDEWLGATNLKYSEGGFEQFRLAVAQHRKVPTLYKEFEPSEENSYITDVVTKVIRSKHKTVGVAYD